MAHIVQHENGQRRKQCREESADTSCSTIKVRVLVHEDVVVGRLLPSMPDVAVEKPGMNLLRAEEWASRSAGCGESFMNWVGAFSGSHVLDSIPLRKASPYLGLSSHERRRERLCGVG